MKRFSLLVFMFAVMVLVFASQVRAADPGDGAKAIMNNAKALYDGLVEDLDRVAMDQAGVVGQVAGTRALYQIVKVGKDEAWQVNAGAYDGTMSIKLLAATVNLQAAQAQAADALAKYNEAVTAFDAGNYAQAESKANAAKTTALDGHCTLSNVAPYQVATLTVMVEYAAWLNTFLPKAEGGMLP